MLLFAFSIYAFIVIGKPFYKPVSFFAPKFFAQGYDAAESSISVK